MSITPKRILREINHTTTSPDGEVLAETRYTESMVTPEPEFVKLYLRHVLMLKDLPNAHHDVLLGVLRQMNWKNEAHIAGTVKQDMLEDLEISLASLDKALKGFVEKGILFKRQRGVYIVNPHIFGKGKWQDIKEIRGNFSYSEAGFSWNPIVGKSQSKSLF